MVNRQVVAKQVKPPMITPNPVVMADASGKVAKPSTKVRRFGRRQQNLADVETSSLSEIPPERLEATTQDLPTQDLLSDRPSSESLSQSLVREQAGNKRSKNVRIQEGQAAIRGQSSPGLEPRPRPKEASLPSLPNRPLSEQVFLEEAITEPTNWQALGLPGGGEKVLLPNQVILTTTAPISSLQRQSSATKDEALEQSVMLSAEVTLPEQVDYINQLSADLEAALFRLRAMSLQAEQQIDRSTPSPRDRAAPILRDCETAVLPYVHQQRGSYVLANRQVDLLKAEREAESTAQLLRRLVDRQVSPPPTDREDAMVKKPPLPRSTPEPRSTSRKGTHSKASPRPLKGGALVKIDPSKHPPQDWLHRWLKPPANWLNALADGLAWMVAAGILRIGLQILLTAYPTLWMPVMLLVVMPVVLAAYQAAFVSKSGWLLAYRLFLVMLGLLLGGRFWSL